MRTGRKGARTNNLHNSHPKTQWLKSPNVSLYFAISWEGIRGKALLGDPSAPRDISGGHFGAIRLASGLTGESRTDSILSWHKGEDGWETRLNWALLPLHVVAMGCLRQGIQTSVVAEGSRRPRGKWPVLRKAGSGSGTASLPPCHIGQGSHRPAQTQRGRRPAS